MNVKKTKYKSKEKKRLDHQSQLIQKKNDEIESLKSTILKLELSCEEKEELISSIDHLREDLKNTIMEIKAKGEEYDALIEDLRQMRNVFAKDVFRGEWRWRIIKWLMK